MELQIDVFTVMTWILFLGLYPMAYFWLRRAYRIFIKKDYSDVALKRGEPPKNPAKWAPYVGGLNLIAGLAAAWAILGVVVFAYPYEVWTEIAGLTIWFKIIGDFIIKTQAHPIVPKKKRAA
ncbi:conserved hypothetical protein [Deferribacter desulfuricans SSM1]|uniref:DUF3784 domain-containing protein n=1 Tax=Deferribacter desulfuricans (strain DSM 14783 / JCM 11476 / NBRC 101012 / SSM1) TaxID=639282 RepID=D3P8J2_DEFDS|nr:hypothetical protein [Deferribacter desulfuricans]BAI81032.1 conserved hypothetical protein [Deferribacter desulfuricans SSM1]